MNAKMLVLALVIGVASPALAQFQVELPRPSPAAKVVQTVGLTEITVEYSSPAVKGRAIWGTLVPYGQVWRAGANAATRVTFAKDVTFGGVAVPAGSYSFFVIPAQTGKWTVILNKDDKASTDQYKKESDVARVEVEPKAAPSRERLAYEIVDFTDDAATFALEWEKVRVAVPVTVATAQQVAASTKAVDENLWQPSMLVARYHLDRKDYDQALAWAEKSLKLRETWLNSWTKAQAFAGKGKYADAHTWAVKTQQLGDKGPRFFYAEDVKQAIAEWKGKK